MHHSFQQGDVQIIPFKNPVSLLDLCAHAENEHSPEILHVHQGLTEMIRQDQDRLQYSFPALQVKIDQQTVSLKNMLLLSPYLYNIG